MEHGSSGGPPINPDTYWLIPYAHSNPIALNPEQAAYFAERGSVVVLGDLADAVLVYGDQFKRDLFGTEAVK